MMVMMMMMMVMVMVMLMMTMMTTAFSAQDLWCSLHIHAAVICTCFPSPLPYTATRLL
jgi:hypothetical protein